MTLVDPTNRFSFLAFLVAKKRIYRFITADFSSASRHEFEEYFRWVAEALDNVEYSREVEAVEFDGEHFVVRGDFEAVSARNLVLGTGQSPKIPECARPHLGPQVFHAQSFVDRELDLRGKRLAVIGGGQTGAEIVLRTMDDPESMPDSMVWVNRRNNFVTLDNSPFVNELFFPNYTGYFHGLPAPARARLLEQQKFFSDGIRPEVLQALYQRMYELEFFMGCDPVWDFLPDFDLKDMQTSGSGYSLTVQSLTTGLQRRLEADYVVLATGWKNARAPCLAPLGDRLPMDEQGFRVREDFSVEWDGPPDRRIYVQNGARHTHGVAEPNLSLSAWRSGVIINSLFERRVYDVGPTSSVVDWPPVHDDDAHASQQAANHPGAGPTGELAEDEAAGTSEAGAGKQPWADPHLAGLLEQEPTPGMVLKEFDLTRIGASQIPFKMSRFRVDPGCRTEPDTHAVHEIWCVASGAGELTYDSQAVRVEEGDAVYFAPHKTHEILNDRNESLEVCSIWWP